MKKITFILLLLASDLLCGEGDAIVSKKTHGNYTTYSCASGKTFNHSFDGFI